MATIHMVRSVKGGSGKTAFALHKVVELANEKDGKFKHSVLFLDADVHASETYTMMHNRFRSEDFIIDKTTGNFYFFDFFNGITEENIMETKEERMGQKTDKEDGHFLNTYIHPYKGFYSKLEEVMVVAILKLLKISSEEIATDNNVEKKKVRFEFAETGGNSSCDIKFIFSDPSDEGRNVFGNIFQSSGRSAVGVGSYVAKMKNLLGYVLDKGSNYTDVVVDMPPGSDTFSEHLANLLIEMAGFDHTLKIYYVTNDDVGHIISSVNAATAHLHQMKNAYINDICLVCNDGRDNSKLFEGKPRNMIINMLCWLVHANYMKDDLNRLSYVHFDRDGCYYKAHRLEWNNPEFLPANRPKVGPFPVIFVDNCIQSIID